MTFAARSLQGSTPGAVISALPANVYNVSGLTAICAYRLTATGDTQTQAGGGAFSSIGSWIVPASGMSAYECRMTINTSSGGGALTGSATGAWLALSADQTWTLSTSGPSGTVDYRYMTLEIRLIAAPATILATGNVNLTGEII